METKEKTSKKNHRTQKSVQSGDIKPPSVIKSGQLLKLGQVRRNWRPRWAVLDSLGELKYFTPDQNSLKGTLQLDQIADKPPQIENHPKFIDKTGQYYGFYIRTAARMWRFRVESEKDRDEWIKEITKIWKELPKHNASEIEMKEKETTENTASHIVTLTILQAKNLPKMDLIFAGDPYVLVRFHSKKNARTYRTHVIKNTRNPVWNVNFSETIMEDDPLEWIELVVKEWDRGKKDDIIGKTNKLFIEDFKQETAFNANKETIVYKWLSIYAIKKRRFQKIKKSLGFKHQNLSIDDPTINAGGSIEMNEIISQSHEKQGNDILNDERMQQTENEVGRLQIGLKIMPTNETNSDRNSLENNNENLNSMTTIEEQGLPLTHYTHLGEFVVTNLKLHSAFRSSLYKQRMTRQLKRKQRQEQRQARKTMPTKKKNSNKSRPPPPTDALQTQS